MTVRGCASAGLTAGSAPLPDRRNPHEWAAAVAFVTLFPGFLLYHYGLSAGWWPAALGGMFGAASAVIAAGAVLLQLQRWHRPLPRLTALHFLLLGLLVHQIGWSLVLTTQIRHEAFMGAAIAESIATVAIWVALAFVGSHLSAKPSAIRMLNALGWLTILVCFGHAFATLGVPAGPFLAFASGEEAGHSTYQGIGRSVLAIAVLSAFAIQPGKLRSLMPLVFAALLLLVVGSRAHFFAAIALILLQLLLLTIRSGTRVTGLVGLVVLSLVAFNSVDLFLETRASEVIDLASSASWEGRAGANAHALSLIADHPLAGSFGYHLWDEAGYAHNILSAWTQFGLLGLLMFAGLLCAGLFVSIHGYFRAEHYSAAWSVALYFNVVAIVLALASEPIMSSVFPPLACGLTLRALRLRAAS